MSTPLEAPSRAPQPRRLDDRREENIDRIQSRVQNMVALLHRGHRGGTARVSLLLDARGYIDACRVIAPTGSETLDRLAEQVLHLGEPYLRVRGWFELDIRFDVRPVL